ncbi:MAG: hypothetical protein C4586_05665 [Anaerolineaceae bacterium]|nr:MAG: hypothetical protein C4586_05665 [Anaerolineaceae bacterium]
MQYGLNRAFHKIRRNGHFWLGFTGNEIDSFKGLLELMVYHVNQGHSRIALIGAPQNSRLIMAARLIIKLAQDGKHRLMTCSRFSCRFDA